MPVANFRPESWLTALHATHREDPSVTVRTSDIACDTVRHVPVSAFVTGRLTEPSAATGRPRRGFLDWERDHVARSPNAVLW